MARAAVWWATVCALSFCCVVAWQAAFSQLARAAEPEPAFCPAGGLTLEGVEQPQQETRATRNDLAEVCAALLERVAAIRDELAGVAGSLEALEKNSAGISAGFETLDADLRLLHKDLGEGKGISVSVANHPETAELTALRTTGENSSEAVWEALWFIAGALCCGIFGYGIWRLGLIRS